jgi:hypothetical protein
MFTHIRVRTRKISIHKEVVVSPRKRTRRKGLLVAAVATVLMGIGACGPKCPDVKSALNEDQVASEDVGRVNKLVEKRKNAITEATRPEGSKEAMSALKFSVTAYELAIEAQLRVIKISPKFEGSSLYAENRATFDEMRCYFDKLVAEGSHLVVSEVIGRDIQKWSQRIKSLLQTKGRISDTELRQYFEEGIKTGSGDE